MSLLSTPRTRSAATASTVRRHCTVLVALSLVSLVVVDTSRLVVSFLPDAVIPWFAASGIGLVYGLMVYANPSGIASASSFSTVSALRRGAAIGLISMAPVGMIGTAALIGVGLSKASDAWVYVAVIDALCFVLSFAAYPLLLSTTTRLCHVRDLPPVVFLVGRGSLLLSWNCVLIFVAVMAVTVDMGVAALLSCGAVYVFIYRTHSVQH